MPSIRGSNGRSRRLKNEINVVPYIDVMLVLLVIFMVTAPMITPGIIELPSVGQAAEVQAKPIEVRSEEHTSELQSLMRISYAVFCVTQKNKNKHTTHQD